MFTPFRQLPLNSLSYTVASIAILVFAAKSFINSYRSGNELTKYFAWLALGAGIGFAFFGLPGWFTLNPTSLRIFYLIGYGIVNLSMLVQARILWFVGPKSKLPYLLLAIPVLIISLVGSTIAWRSASLTVEPGFINFIVPTQTAYLTGAMFLLLAFPTGIIFIRGGARYFELASRFKSALLGTAYVVTASFSAVNYFVYQNRETKISSIAYLVIFSLLLCVTLWPNGKLTTEPDRRDTESNIKEVR